jgi:arylsulfatase A-like enzyme
MFGRKTGLFWPDSLAGLPAEEITLAEALREAGYATAIIGKWHLGHLPEYLPMRHGFDSWFGIPYSNDMDKDLPAGVTSRSAFFEPDIAFWQVPLMRNDEVVERPAKQTTITRRYTEEAVRFIRDHRGEPFFLYLPHTMPHLPLFASEAFRGRSDAGLYGDVIEEIDWGVGQILDTLDAEGLADNTLVVFTSDNGPWLSFKTLSGSAGPLRHGKGTTFEGGMRVPAIFWWPNQIAPAVIREIGSAMDLFTTALRVAGLTPPKDRPIDGVDLSLVLFGAGSSPRETMAYYRMGELYAFRQGAYKVHFVTEGSYGLGPPRKEHNPPLLFNLNHDPGERFNVAKDQPDIFAEVLSAAERHRANVTMGEPLFDLRGER